MNEIEEKMLLTVDQLMLELGTCIDKLDSSNPDLEGIYQYMSHVNTKMLNCYLQTFDERLLVQIETMIIYMDKVKALQDNVASM